MVNTHNIALTFIFPFNFVFFLYCFSFLTENNSLIRASHTFLTTQTREENNSSTSLFSRFILSLWSSQRCPSERLKRYILKKTHFIRPKSWQETHLNEKRSNQLRCSDACIWNHMVVLLMAKLHLLYFNTKMPRTSQRVQNSVVGYKTTQKLKACFS